MNQTYSRTWRRKIFSLRWRLRLEERPRSKWESICKGWEHNWGEQKELLTGQAKKPVLRNSRWEIRRQVTVQSIVRLGWGLEITWKTCKPKKGQWGGASLDEKTDPHRADSHSSAKSQNPLWKCPNINPNSSCQPTILINQRRRGLCWRYLGFNTANKPCISYEEKTFKAADRKI